MITTDYTKCLSCRWRDRDNVQCYDGHLQMPNKKECEGYEHSKDSKRDPKMELKRESKGD